MNKAPDLASRFKEVIFNGAWVANTNYRAQLDGLDWKIATTKIANLNTIAVLAQHINYYIAGVNKVFNGGALEIRDAYSFDFPPIKSQKEWETFVAQFWNNAERFASFIEQLPEGKFAADFIDEKYGTYLRNIDGMIEHSYYHLGQIVLIKKLLQKK
jgi:hypothetical protein